MNHPAWRFAVGLSLLVMLGVNPFMPAPRETGWPTGARWR